MHGRDVTRKILGTVYFVIAVSVLVFALKAANWLPTIIDEGTVRTYRDIESVKAKLGIREVLVPVYFPEPLGWPPSEIIAQRRPFEAVVMEFRRTGDDRAALIISQAARREFAPDERIRFTEVRESVPYDLSGRAARLEAGLCRDGSPCSRLSWDEGAMHVRITMRAAPFEVIRLADSMLP